jgi:V8-like Glu-specific endopeptidase
MQNGFLLSVTMVVGLTGPVLATDKGVYGEDDRRDVFHVENDASMRRMARSTAAIVDVRDIRVRDEGKFRLVSETHGEQMQLCHDEAFVDQPSAAYCSSFLVAKDLVVSAGHCFMEPDACESAAFVFDFAYNQESDQPELLNHDQIYTCKAILAVNTDQDSGLDYAIVRLDRPALDREPLVLNQSDNIKTGDDVTVIGNPSGLPTKIAAGAKVRQTSDPISFTTNLDTFQGNSGSAVFNTETKKVEGILVRGDIDYEFDELSECRRVKRCADDGCDGEAATRVSAFYDELSELLATKDEEPPH